MFFFSFFLWLLRSGQRLSFLAQESADDLCFSSLTKRKKKIGSNSEHVLARTRVRRDVVLADARPDRRAGARSASPRLPRRRPYMALSAAGDATRRELYVYARARKRPRMCAAPAVSAGGTAAATHAASGWETCARCDARSIRSSDPGVHGFGPGT